MMDLYNLPFNAKRVSRYFDVTNECCILRIRSPATLKEQSTSYAVCNDAQ
jgi:hypothetical protein